jgi:transcriptional regulator with XRE-family HTH domain
MSKDISNIVEASAAEHLGKRIRNARMRHNLTLEVLAERSGVSRAMLSKIERGENNPTLVVVAKIAVALNLTLSELIGMEERQQAVKVSAAQQWVFRDPDTGFERHVFPAFEGGNVTLTRHVIPVGQGSGLRDAHAQPKEKYMIMEQGQVQVTIGEIAYEVEAGEVFYFRADMPHGFRNVGIVPCRYMLVIVVPPT